MRFYGRSPWRPGESGNPGGRPRGFLELRQAARNQTTECLAALVDVRDGKVHPALAPSVVAAAREILSRGWGQPRQMIEQPVVKSRITFEHPDGRRETLEFVPNNKLP